MLKKTIILLLCLFSTIAFAISSQPIHKGFTKFENMAYKSKQQNLAYLMQALRLLNPYPRNSISWNVWHEQTQINVPILILSSFEINEYCKKTQMRSMLFSARGCCHLIKIFSKLFPKYDSTYFHASRIVYRNPTPEYLEYVQSLYSPTSLIVDEHGAGISCCGFFLQQFGLLPNYFTLARYCGRLPCISHHLTAQLEALNYDLVGVMISFNKYGPVRTQPEYPLEHVVPAHKCIEKCLELMNYRTFTQADRKLVLYFYSQLKKYQPVLWKYHVKNHDKPPKKKKSRPIKRKR